MTNKKIFDIEGIGEFNNPDLLRPIQEQLPNHNFDDQFHDFNNQEQPTIHTHQTRQKKRRQIQETPKRKKALKKKKPTAVLWIIFILATAGFMFYVFTLYTGNNSSLSKLFLNFNDLYKITIGSIIWLILFITLLFISNKKIGVIFLILVLSISNFSAFKANELMASFQRLFSDNTTTPTAIKTSTKNILTEPFTVLVLGVDADDSESPKSSSQPGSGYRSDSMILVTVNPKTHKADMVTTPRDTFLQDSCTKTTHKLTEFIGGGVKCTINTIESLYNVKIDYFVQANFAAVVQIVDALGGIEADIPDLTSGYITWVKNWIAQGGDADASVNTKKLNELLQATKQKPQWCEVDSHRNPYVVCFSQFGPQTVDGEHALAFARSRHYDSDYARGMRQTEVIRAIIQKMASPSGLLKLQSILEKLKTTYALETNMTFSQMTDIMSYSESLSGRDTDNFQVRKYQPLGSDETSSYGLVGSGILLYKQSVYDIRSALAITLETAPPAPIADSEYYDTIEYPAFKTNGG